MATIHVEVTAADIAAGVAGNCHRCPVALALARATGDDDANVHERDWILRVEVWGRSIIAPSKVQEFVRSFDGLPRDDDDHPDTEAADFDPPEPFVFDLPDSSDPEWEEACCRCEELFDPSELDDEGCCKGCRD